MEGIKVDIADDISLWIEGYYEKGEPENNIPSSFNIENIESLYKDLYPLCEWMECNSIDELSELALEEFEKNI